MVASAGAGADGGPAVGDAGGDVPVARAPSDVLRLVVSAGLLLITIVVGAVFGDAVVDFAARLLGGLETLPAWLVESVALVAQGAAVVLAGAGIVTVVRSRSWRLLSAVVVAAVGGALVATGLVHLVDARAKRVTDVTSVLAFGQGSTWSAAGLGGLAAGVASVSPWLARRWRRTAWAVLVVVALASFVSNPLSFDALLALLAGWVVGTAVTVVAGAPSHRPTPDAIVAGLRSVGVDLARLEPASVDARGSTPYFGETAAHTKLFVKALGQDERSADVLFRLYRRVRRRELGDEKPFSTLRRSVEHEALVSLTARDLGVRTPRLVALSTATPNAFVLAYEAVDGRSLDRLAAGELGDDVLDATWAQLALLRRHRVAHRDLRLANLFLADDGSVWLIDFGFSEIAAPDLLLTSDLAELLASSASVVGVQRAVAAGTRALGPDVIRAALDRLEPRLLSGATRTAMKGDPTLLPDLRGRVAALAS